jgi:putative sigma-54 modulation protein
MQIHITFRHMDATDALKTHVNDKSERLNKFAPATAEGHWVLFVEADSHVAELRVTGPHTDVFAQAKTIDMYQSIEDAVGKVEKQLRKQKEIVKDHLHRQRHDHDAE